MFADSWAMSAAGRTARRSSSRSRTARVVWRLRQDLLVVRELAVDQPADEVDALEVEQDLVLGRGEDDLDRVVGVGEDPRQLVERPCRDRRRSSPSTGVEDRDRLDRDPVVVGGGERQLVALEPGQDAGQDRPGLVAGGRERRSRRGPAGGRSGAMRVVGRSPAAWMAGNSSASMPLMWVSNRPQRRCSVSPALELEVDALAARAAS